MEVIFHDPSGSSGGMVESGPFSASASVYWSGSGEAMPIIIEELRQPWRENGFVDPFEDDRPVDLEQSRSRHDDDAAQVTRCALLRERLAHAKEQVSRVTELEFELSTRLTELACRRGALESALERCSEELTCHEAKLQRRVPKQEELAAASPRQHQLHTVFSVNRPVGLPNRQNDCFWLATLQCLRHTPGFVEAIAPAAPASSASATNLLEAVANLMQVMTEAEVSGPLTFDNEAVSEFRFHAMNALPASDKKSKLIQSDSALQRQQDAHEFLSQLLSYLGSEKVGSEEPEQVETLDTSQLEALQRELSHAARLALDAKEGEKKSQNSDKTAALNLALKNGHNLLYEYSMIQWATSATRMRTRSLGNIFEGQRLSSLTCASCGRYGVSGAEPFVVEDVRVYGGAQDSAWYSPIANLFASGESVGVPLEDLLREQTVSPFPEGYRCPNSKCGKVGRGGRILAYYRLPRTFIIHVNRAQPDGSRCAMVLKFGMTLDMRALGLVRCGPAPLDRDLEPCESQYTLYAAVFHQGVSAHRGHYFSYILFNSQWVCVNDNQITHPTSEARLTPMQLEASEPSEGAKVSLLFYRRVK
jgi:ubiquitin C-terminal hydrolase